VLQEEDFSPDRLVGMINTFIDNQVLARRMRTASLAQGKPDAARSILDMVRRYASPPVRNNTAETLRPEAIAKRHT